MPDEETLALAKELGLGTEEPPKPPSTPEPPPKGDGTPTPGDTKGDQPPKGKEGEVEGEPEGEPKPPDPMDELAKDPKFLQKVLAHKTLGPKFNTWADNAAKEQVRAATAAQKGTAEQQAELKAREATEDRFFEGLSEEELAEELKDPDCAAAYGRYQLRQGQKSAALTKEQIEYGIKAQSIVHLIQTYRQLVETSELPDEKKAELQPEKFVHLGKDALLTLGKTIYEALVEDGVQKRFDTEWASVQEERLADLDGSRPAPTGGRAPGKMLDLMKTDSSVGLEQALALEAQKKRK